MTTLHLQQASLQFSDTKQQRRVAVKAALARNAHVVGFTEAAEKSTRDIIREECVRAGYIWVPGAGDGGFAVRKDVKRLNVGAVMVNPKDPRPPSKGGHAARFVNWVKCMFEGEVFVVHEGHWLTGLHKGGKRLIGHQAMTRAMGHIVSEHGEGLRLSFWMGDTNVDDADNTPGYDNILKEHGLTSIWDELDVYPSTHRDNTIDVIGTFDADKRVTLDRYKVWPPGPGDHRHVSAWFDIKEKKR